MKLTPSRWGVALVLVTACSDPALNMPTAPAALQVSIEPLGELGHALPTFRARVEQAGDAEPWLLAGSVSAYQARSVEQGELSSSLRDLAVPLFYWRDAAGLWLQPLRWLEPGQTYTLALLGRGVAGSWVISEEAVPRAELLFPATGSALAVAAHCGPGLQARGAASLSPGGALQAEPWAGPESCVVWSAPESVGAPAVLPPALDGVLLAPVLFGARATPSSGVELHCPGRLVHGSCVETLDDRVLVTALSADSLWLLEEPAPRIVAAPVGHRVALARGLPAASQTRVRGSLLLDRGVEAVDVELEMAAPALHLIITEVMANPLGAEPSSEWVELFNDSAAAAPLAGLWLTDGSASTPLPAATLAPGEVALLVSPGFAPSADVAAARGTRILELGALGARGLGNGGEALMLYGAGGVQSRFPAVPASRAGRSIARLRLDAHDDDSRAFAVHDEPGASPGAAHWSN